MKSIFMKIIFSIIAIVPLLLYGGVAEMAMGGRLKLNDPEIELRGTLFTEGWKQSASNGGMSFPDSDGLCEFALKISAKQIVNGAVGAACRASVATRL